MFANRRALAVIAPLCSRCSLSLDVCSYNHAREIVNWSIVRSGPVRLFGHVRLIGRIRYVGIHWIALTGYSQTSIHIPGF